MEVYGVYRSNVALIRDALAENKVRMRAPGQYYCGDFDAIYRLACGAEPDGARGAIARHFSERPRGRGARDAAHLHAHGKAAQHTEEHRSVRAGTAEGPPQLRGNARGNRVLYMAKTRPN